MCVRHPLVCLQGMATYCADILYAKPEFKEIGHPNLVFLVHEAMALQIMDFGVRDGVRSLEQQKRLVSRGMSKTMRSKHLVQHDGYAHAVDLYPYPINMKGVRTGNAREIIRFGVLSGILKTLGMQHGIFLTHAAAGRYRI